MEKFVIEGGRVLSGEVTPDGNKNEALPVLAATLLASGPVTLENIPDIRDVQVMLQVIASLGADVTHEGSTVTVDPTGIPDSPKILEPELSSKIRASILFAGPLLARYGSVTLAPPGGDVIGRRRLDTHFSGFQDMGARFEVTQVYALEASAGLNGVEIFMDEASVTATENLVMAAALAHGTTRLLNAACEPHVQGLCNMLNSMGAKISGIGTNALTIEGVEKLSGCTHRIGPDYLEVGSFIGLAAMTGGELFIRDVRESDMRMILRVFERLGIKTEFRGTTLVVPPRQNMVIQKDLHGAIPKIDDAPWPAFPTD